ncbi:AraC-type DNA-binding protein [Allokutzneria albata]|uniref:AraC-type DNA-binding protein n=1 Tax=Allokutzneria albata TaxID=211114 RepID=A0A1G9R8R4_ALLAB|nr:AraC-type DNA-binding protein [Allokutzneria albata]
MDACAHNGGVASEWSCYWRAADRPIEVMRARFDRHVYHRHSHDAYSFGITERGAQSFTCRGGGHVSAEGMVMAFNPDDPHDGRSATEPGFTYRIVHIGPELVADVIGDATGKHSAPLFSAPVLDDPVLGAALRRLSAALVENRGRLEQDEAVTAAVLALARRGSTSPPGVRPESAPVERARELLHAEFHRNIGAAELAAAAGCSRHALHRGFLAAHGMAASDYQRQVRLRAARRLLEQGRPPAEVAAEVGFADQPHLTRWFARYYGITPAAYRSSTVITGR